MVNPKLFSNNKCENVVISRERLVLSATELLHWILNAQK